MEVDPACPYCLFYKFHKDKSAAKLQYFWNKYYSAFGEMNGDGCYMLLKP